jgi:hypothetical protein
MNKGKNFPSFWTLLTIRHADLLARFVYASQQLPHWLPWSTEPRNWSTK